MISAAAAAASAASAAAAVAAVEAAKVKAMAAAADAAADPAAKVAVAAAHAAATAAGHSAWVSAAAKPSKDFRAAKAWDRAAKTPLGPPRWNPRPRPWLRHGTLLRRLIHYQRLSNQRLLLPLAAQRLASRCATHAALEKGCSPCLGKEPAEQACAEVTHLNGEHRLDRKRALNCSRRYSRVQHCWTQRCSPESRAPRRTTLKGAA